MKYILGLVFEYYKFKKAGTVRIYADDMLVDEFFLEKSIGMKAIGVDKFPAYAKKITVPNRCRVLMIPDTIFLFEIDDEHLKNKITVEVENDNNNYINGFMTKYSWLKLHDIFLIPSCLLNETNLWRLERFVDTGHGRQYGDVFPNKPNIGEGVVLRSDKPWTGDYWNYEKGGNFSFDLHLSKKYNTVQLGKLKPGRIELRRSPWLILWAAKWLNTNT